MNNNTFKDIKKKVINEINNALDRVDENYILMLIDDISNSNKVFFVGVGRVMLSLQAFAKRLFHLGISAHCVGDINEPAISKGDLLIVGSGSGASLIPIAIAEKAFSLGAKIVHIGSNPNSKLKTIASYLIRIPVKTRLNLSDEIQSEQIMTSLFEQTLLILGDIISKMIANKKVLDFDLLWSYHANLE